MVWVKGNLREDDGKRDAEESNGTLLGWCLVVYRSRRIIEEIQPYITGDFTVADIKRAKIWKLFFNEAGDRFFKFKVYFITLDEKSGAEKKTVVNMFAQACTLKEAIAVLEEGMKSTMADYSIGSVAETMLMDVFPFAVDDKKRGSLTDMSISSNIKQLQASIPEG